MASNTKQAIIECTINLAETKPFNKITVNDIVKACGITRNTFYYYFHDIYHVLEVGMDSYITRLKTCPPEEYDDAFFELIEYSTLHKKLWCNVYKTAGHDALQRYITNTLHEVLVSFIMAQLKGEEICKFDLELICIFYEEALFGVMTRWLRDEKNYTSEEAKLFSRRARVLFQGMVPKMLENLKNNK